MRIRRFVAKTSQEALRKVKREMGPKAVILGSRTLERDESPEGQPLLEVTAAVDIDALPEKSAAARGAATEQEQDPVDVRWRRLEQELQELKEILWSTEARSTLGIKILYNAELHRLYAASRELGIHSTFIRPILDEYRRHRQPGANDSMKNWLHQALVQLLAKVELGPLSLANGDKLIWSFVGPTGVGKTTTIAKLAAQTALQQGRRVALITVDQYRIGAIEQMRSYAQIMRLPLETAANAAELGRAIQKHNDKQVLFIDSAGRSPSQQKDLAELAGVFQVPFPIQHQLVLSATTKYQDLVTAATAFEPLNCANYIFTKVDETSDGAAMVNFLLSRPRPLSYFTIGQQVPEDIEPASKKRLAHLLLQRLRGSEVLPINGEAKTP